MKYDGSEPASPVGTTVEADPRVERVRARYHRLLGQALDPNEWAYAWRTELNRGGFRAVDFLMDEIVHTGKCIGCASCVTICPVDVFDYEGENPRDTRTDACVLCVLCAEVCPVLRPPDKDLANLIGYRQPVGDGVFGSYSYGVYTRTTRPDILEVAQDGGLVSALLIHGLETGAWKGAILGDVMPDNRQIGRHKLAMTEQDVLSCAASRYTYSPNTLAFQEAIQQDVTPVAVVGVPCQIDGVRLQQNSSIRSAMSTWYRTNVALTIGLFCSEAFTHESIAKLGEMIEVAPERIDNINIKGKVVVRLDDGTILNTSLKQYRQWARPACLYCLDYSAEHADIGAGGIGIDGWTYTLVRTEAGHQALTGAIDAGLLETRPLEDEPRGEFLLNKLSADKKLNRPLPAQMPTLQERQALGYTDPKTFYTKGPGAPAPADEGSR
jgi:coenzyme F420 hydrogenase subunit beta